jgi:hypothetical protein
MKLQQKGRLLAYLSVIVLFSTLSTPVQSFAYSSFTEFKMILLSGREQWLL